jgi:hypothetical protein
MLSSKRFFGGSLAVFGAGVLIGYFLARQTDNPPSQPADFDGARAAEPNSSPSTPRGYTTPRTQTTPLHLLQSPAAVATNRPENDFGLGDGHISKLLPYPPGGKGVRTPFDLWRYAGAGESSFGTPTLPMPWDQ